MRLEEAVEHAAEPIARVNRRGPPPGGVLGAVDVSGARSVVVAGWAQFDPDRIPMTRETVFDLASLIRTIFTTTAVLELVAAEVVALDQPWPSWVPDLRQHDLSAPERSLTLRQCLTHQIVGERLLGWLDGWRGSRLRDRRDA